MSKETSLKYVMCSKEGLPVEKLTVPTALKYFMCSVQGEELTPKETADLLDPKKGSIALKYLMCSEV